MSKINDNFKKQVDSFNKQVNSYKRQTPKKTPYRDIKIDNINTESKKLSGTYNKYISGFNYNVPKDTDVADTGINEASLNKDVLYSNDNYGVAPKKMRRIRSSSKDNTLERQSGMMSHMFRNQSNMLSKMHSEKMTMSAKFNNTLISHVKNISDQVSQINKVKNGIQLDFYTNSLTTQNNILEELKSINDTLKTGFNLNPKGERNVNRETDSLIKHLFSPGGGSFKSKSKQLLKQLGKDAVDQVSGGQLGLISMSLSMIPTMLMGMGGIKGLLTYGGKSAIGMGIDQLGKRNRSARMASNLLSRPGDVLEDIVTSWGVSGTGIKKWIGKKVGRKDGKAKIFDITSVLNKDHKERANFDTEAHTALTRVITRYLSRIESTLSGKPIMYYNYHTNRFETPEEAKRMLSKGETAKMKKEVEDLEKRIISSFKVKKNVFGDMKDVEEDGLWKQLTKITNDVKDANLDFVQKSIKSKGQQLGEYLIRLIAFLARHTPDPGKILDTNIDVKILMRAIHGKEAVKKADKQTLNKMAESAFSFRMFLEALRDIPQKDAKKIWNTLITYANNLRDTVTTAMDDAFEEAEGSIAAWEQLTYKEIYDESKKKMRSATRHELDKAYSDSKKNFSFLSSNIGTDIIDLSGITDKDIMKGKLIEEYNKMVGPLFLNGNSKIGANLKAKVAQLKKQNHMFAPYLEKLSNAYDKTGLSALEGKDYAKMSGLNTYSDLMEMTKPPEMNTWTIGETIKSAKNVAKWHMENNAKTRGIATIGAAGAYATLISTMAKNSGMTGPIGSMMLGVGAASSAIFSGKLTTAVDIMTTSLGDEKMIGKDGKETNVTKRQALMEATYKEMLPKTWGMKQGMKFGGWIRNNVRFGPILGPVIGFATGKLLGGASTWLVKIAGLFGKMGKGLMNSLGRKFTGDENMSWGDNIRDLMRTAMGLAPVGEKSFTMDEVMKQSGAKSGSHNIINVATGYRKPKKQSIEERYKAAREYVNQNKLITSSSSKVVKPVEDKTVTKKEKINSVKESVSTTLESTLSIRLVGGNLDTVSVIGAIDAEAYKNRLISLNKSASQDVKKSTSKDDSQKSQESIKKAVVSNLQDNIQFATNDKEFKDEYEDQDRQEKIEQQDRDNIQRIADSMDTKKTDKKKKKKKSKFSLITSALAGFLFLPQILEGAQKAVPVILDTLNPLNWVKKAGDAFNYTADKFYQKRQPGDVLPDGKISLGVDMARFFMNYGKNAKQLKNIGKFLWGAAKLIPGVKQAVWIAKNTIGRAGKAIGSKVSKFGGKVLSAAASKIDDVAIKIVSEGSENVIKNGWKSFGQLLKPKAGGKLAKLLGYVYKGLNFLGKLIFKIPGLKKFGKYLSESIVPYAKKIFTELVEKFADKLVKKGGTVAASKSFIGSVKGVLTSGVFTAVVNLAFIAWDAWQGAKKAKDFFEIPDTDRPTAWQTYACAVTYGAMSLIECIPGAFIVTAVLSSIDGVMKWLCFRFYEFMMAILKPLGIADSDANLKHFEEIKNKNKNDETTKGLPDNFDPEKIKELSEKANEQQLKMREDGASEEQIAQEVAKIYGQGGTGQRYKTSIDSPRIADNNAPAFFSQRQLERKQIGSMNTNDDGCALAVMKMIAAHKGVNLSDATLTNHMQQHILSNRTVSTAFFEDFGGKITSNRDDIKSSLLSGRAIMALLIQNRGYKHFVAIIAKDKNNVYVGDPLKSRWEVMSKTDNKLITYSVAAAIFQGGIVTNIGLPKTRKQGGTGIGGFGSKVLRELKNLSKGAKEKVSNSLRQNIVNIFNNQSGQEYVEETSQGNVDPGTGIAGGLSFSAKGITDNGGWKWDQLPNVQGKGYKNMAPLINALSSKFNIPADAITAMMYLESGLDPNQKTGSYRGLGQLNNVSWKATLTESMGGLKYNGAAYGVPDIGQGGVLTDPRQNGTLFLARMAHDAKVIAKHGIDNISTGMLHMTHMLPTSLNYIGSSNPNLMEMKGVKRSYIDGNAPLTTSTGKKGGSALSLNDSIAKFNEFHSRKLAEAKGGSGGPRSVSNIEPYEEVQYYGRGVGISDESIKTCFVKQKDVGTVLGLNGKENTTCGIACALMLQKLIYFNDHKKYDAKAVKRFADEKKLFDKDLGVSQRFFEGFGMQKYNLDTIRAKEGKVKIGTFADQDHKGNPRKWGIQNHEIAILNAGGHWVLLVRRGGVPWLLDPMQNGPLNLFERRDLAQKEVDYGVHTKDAGRIINILKGQASHIGGMGSGAEGKQKNGGVVSSDSSSSSSTGAVTDLTTTSTTNANGDTVQETPIKGTSAALGGWFYKGENGEFKQFFFGTKKKVIRHGGSTDGGSINGGQLAGSTGAAFPMMKDTIPLPIIPALKLKDGDKPFEAAKHCVKGSKGGSISKCREFTVNAMIKAGYPKALQTTWRQGSQDRAAGRGIPGPSSNVDQQIGLPPDHGFTMISILSPPQPGDVCIIWPFGTHESGHVQMYCGPEAGAKNSGWVSDFDQRRSTPYKEGSMNNGYGRRITLYRDSNFCAKPTGMSSASTNSISATPSKQINNKQPVKKGKGYGGDGSGDVTLKNVTNRVANYYSTGSVTYNTAEIYDKTVENAKKTISKDYSPFEEAIQGHKVVKKFKMSYDRSRNLSLMARDSMAKARYHRETRKIDESMNTKRWGIFKARYKDSDDIMAKSLSTASGAIQDVKTKSPVINAFLELSGALIDNTVQTKIGTKAMLETNKKHTEVLKEQVASTSEAGKSLEKKEVPIINIVTPIKSSDIKIATLGGMFNYNNDNKKELFAN